MSMQVVHLAALAIFTSLSLNLLFQFALGLGGITKENKEYPLPFFQLLVLFLSVIILWAIFTYILSPLMGVWVELFLLFPLAALACIGLELFFRRFLPQLMDEAQVFDPITAYDGLALAALLLSLYLASSFIDAIILSFSFVFGLIFSIIILRAIHQRAVLEQVPLFLRGIPLTLIAMGLISLISSATVGVFLRVLGLF